MENLQRMASGGNLIPPQKIDSPVASSPPAEWQRNLWDAIHQLPGFGVPLNSPLLRNLSTDDVQGLMSQISSYFTTPPAPTPTPPGQPVSQFLNVGCVPRPGMFAAAHAAANPLTAPDKGPASYQPFGSMAGTVTRNALYDPLGSTRPLGPGENVRYGNLSANEMDYNVPTNDSETTWKVVPGLWLIDGVPTHVTEDQALQLANQSGLNFPTFTNKDKKIAKAMSDHFVKQREANWELNANTYSQPSLWSFPK
jgi:hypothetical protein